MPKIQWFVPDLQIEGDAILSSISNGRTKAIYDLSGGSHIILTGEKLKAEPGSPGELGSGTVEKIVIKDEDGNIQMTAVGKYKASVIGDQVSDSYAYGLYYHVLFEGDDTIRGSREGQSIWGSVGDDTIIAGGGEDAVGGGAGDDDLRGGKGADYFYFYFNEKGHDIIRDLDIKGADADDLYITGDNGVERIRSVNKHHDTMLELADGSTILIKNVTRAEFIDYWDVT